MSDRDRRDPPDGVPTRQSRAVAFTRPTADHARAGLVRSGCSIESPGRRMGRSRVTMKSASAWRILNLFRQARPITEVHHWERLFQNILTRASNAVQPTVARAGGAASKNPRGDLSAAPTRKSVLNSSVSGRPVARSRTKRCSTSAAAVKADGVVTTGYLASQDATPVSHISQKAIAWCQEHITSRTPTSSSRPRHLQLRQGQLKGKYQSLYFLPYPDAPP